MRTPVLRLLYILLFVVGLVAPQSVVLADADETDFAFEVGTPTFSLAADGIAVPGYTLSNTPGAPVLPFDVKTVELPAYGDWDVTYEVSGSYVLPSRPRIQSAPVPEPVADSPLSQQSLDPGSTAPIVERPDPAIYGTDALYPRAPVVPGDEGCQRGKRLLPVRVFPFQYNPVTHELLYHPQIKVTIHLRGAASGACGEHNVATATAAVAQSPNAELGAVLARTTQRGMHALTYADLQAIGVPVDSLDPASFQMTLGGQPVQLHIVSQNVHSFAPGDLVIFYAEPYMGRWSSYNVYRFSWGSTGAPSGSQMGTRSTTKTGDLMTTVTQLLHVERDRDYYSTYPISVEADHFFDAVMNPTSSNPSVSASYDLALDDPVTTGTVQISGRVYGGKNQASNPDQSFELKLNAQSVAVHRWEGRTGYDFTNSTSATSLLATGNKLNLVAATAQLSGISDYYIYPDEFDILYPALAEVEGDRTYVAGLQTDQTAVKLHFTGFSVSAVRAYDVRNPKSPVILTTLEATASGATFAVDVWDAWDVPGSTRQYALSTDASMLKPTLERDWPSNWKSTTNSYDYIAIVHSSLSASIQPLLDRRVAAGLRVAKVDVQDIYDEFNYGQAHQQAIRDFLGYAYDNWNQGEANPPQYVLLVGDGHYDFRNVLGTPVPNLVPPFLINIDPWIGETAADNRFVSLDGAGDYLPDMSIGRIPAWTAADVTAVVDKIAAYEDEVVDQDQPWQSTVVFVADDDANPAGNFHAFSDNVRVNLPSDFTSPTIYYNPDNTPAGVGYTTVAAMKAEIKQAFNDGAVMMQWFGHASKFRWGVQNNLWKVWDVATLTPNNHLPFTVSYSCWTGYFVNLFGYTDGAPMTPVVPHYQTLGETHLLQPGRGSIADLSPSGQHVGSALAVLNQGLVKAVFQDRIAVVGNAVDAARLYFHSTSTGFPDVIDTSVLFGDPALRLRLPQAQPVPPQVTIDYGAAAATVALGWQHLEPDSSYHIWRGSTPYFVADTEGVQVGQVSAAAGASVGDPVSYTDDGTNPPPPVTVVGDVAVNYFWIVRGANSRGVSADSNRVGEFDFALVKGQ